MTDPIRVLLVDDDPLVRSALALMLGGQSTLSVVGEAADGSAGIAAVQAHRPDVVLMDIRMPGMDGLTATRQLMAGEDPPRIIILTTFDADEHVLGAISAGAHGFLLKDTPPPQLVTAIERVYAGEPMLSPSATVTLLRRVREAAPDRAAAATERLRVLTPREREVAIAIGQGLSNADIAAALFLSVPTVKAHVSKLFDKLGCTNRVQIAMCVHDAELV